ncbi:MAG: sugar porter family MFS transporter [Bacteriovoracaceae bacterium]
MITNSGAAGALDSDRYNKGYVWMISVVAAFGGLLFGYDFVVIGGAKPFYEKFFSLMDPAAQGWAMSCALIGCLFGALIAGPASDRWGRKYLLILSAFLFGVSSIATGYAPSYNFFIFWRIVGGLAIGLASGLSPLYIAEVSPAKVRGRLVSLNQFTVVIGILLAQIVNYLIAEPVPEGATADQILNSWNGQTGWRWMFAVTAVPSVLFFASALFIPESPRWLAKKGRKEEARKILGKIFGDHADHVLKDVESTIHSGDDSVNWSALKEPKVKNALVIGIALAVFQQWCGINVIFNYAEEIFASAGYSVSGILFNIVITGIVNVAATIAALALVDKLGRRALMLWGSAALAVVYVILGACYHYHVTGIAVLILVLLAIACYGVSLAPVVWVVISEIFPNRIRGVAMSIAVGALWVACFVLTYTFPIMNKALGAAGTFWIYAGICALGFAFTYQRLPETKGKTLEEIEESF